MTTRVALLGRDDAVRATLRSALVDAGAELAFEGDLQGADAQAIRASVARILIVNLEPGTDSELDSLDSLMEDPAIDVLFNEAEVTGQLAGWDLARWARHLVAKVLGHRDTTPPPPPGAEMLPERNLMPRPGAPKTPAEEVGDSDLSSFADEANASLSGLPQSTLPDALTTGQSRAVTSDIESPEPTDTDEVEMPRLDRDSTISAPMETASTDVSDDFDFDLGEIEQALNDMGSRSPNASADAVEVAEPESSVEDMMSDVAESVEAVSIEVVQAFDDPDDPERSASLDFATDLGRETDDTEAASTSAADDGLGHDLDAMSTIMAEDEPTTSDLPDQTAETVSSESSESSGSEDFPEFDLGDIEASLAGIDSDAPSTAQSSDETSIDEGLGIDFDFDLNVGEADTTMPASGGDDFNLEDDADFAALAAQFDAQSDDASPEKVPAGLDDIGFRALEEASEEQDLTDRAASLESALDFSEASADVKTTAGNRGEASEDEGALSASLSLLDLDAEIETKEAKKEEKSGGYDFDSLSLSLELEPLESEEDEVPSFITARKKPAAGPKIKGVPRIFVLGASIGGPDALRTFISHIPADFPGLFVLAQHLESGFFSRLAHQLQKTSKLLIRVADDDQGPAKVGQLLVVTSAAKFSVDRDGKITQATYDQPPHYKPCIDDLFMAAAETFGKDCVAIIFSGMAGDAVEGASRVTANGGEVWVQDPSSCVVSSMVDGAKARGSVEFSGSPRELAERCVARFGQVE